MRSNELYAASCSITSASIIFLSELCVKVITRFNRGAGTREITDRRSQLSPRSTLIGKIRAGMGGSQS